MGEDSITMETTDPTHLQRGDHESRLRELEEQLSDLLQRSKVSMSASFLTEHSLSMGTVDKLFFIFGGVRLCPLGCVGFELCLVLNFESEWLGVSLFPSSRSWG